MKRAVAALALVLVLAGCEVPASPNPRRAPTTTSASSPAVEWADRLCAVILEYDSGTPKFEINSSSQDAAVQSLKTSLEAMSVQLNKALERLRDVGTSPVAGGDEAAQGLMQAFSDRRAVVDRVRARLSTIDPPPGQPKDPTAVSQALQEVARDLQTLRAPVNPLEGMGARFPELQTAARSADNCTEITRIRASRSASPPTPSTPPFPSDGFPTTPSTPGSGTPGSGTTTPSTPPTTETTIPTI